MTKIIAELGINHDGSYKKCKELIKQAYLSNCWAIKFQYRNLDNYFFIGNSSNEIGKELIDKEIKKNFLSKGKIISLSNYARKIGLQVGISFFLKKDVYDFNNFAFDFYKIPSASAEDFDLIKAISKKKKLLIISLGGKSYEDIKNYKNLIAKISRKEKTVIMHCIVNYPLHFANAQLGTIDQIKYFFKGYQIGYSSHEVGIYNCILALSKNISFIERHITLSKNAIGLDHSSSSTPEELKLLCEYSKNFEKIYTNSFPRYINQGELINMQNLTPGIYAKKNLKRGSKINQKGDIFLSYPSTGFTFKNLRSNLKKKIRFNFKKNMPINISLFLKEKNISQKTIDILKKKKISLPIRPHDYVYIDNIFKLERYELHLSYTDIKSKKFLEMSNNFFKKKIISIHLPDYCNEDNLVNFFSKNRIIAKQSKLILNNCIKLAKKIKKVNGQKNVCIVASFSLTDENADKISYYRDVKKFIKKINNKDIQLAPQWLPPFAWYFGGSKRLFAFCNPDDLFFLKRINIKICLDVSHFILSCNFFKIFNKINTYFRNYISLFTHIHLSDAYGIDGEGVHFGEGDLLKSNILKDLFRNNKQSVVLETWQGHLNNLYNFKKDIIFLKNFFTKKKLN